MTRLKMESLRAILVQLHRLLAVVRTKASGTHVGMWRVLGRVLLKRYCSLTLSEYGLVPRHLLICSEVTVEVVFEVVSESRP